ncbi:transcription elongation factor GreA [Bacteroidetes bacterium endosymbiont of Geopemphigus sp.]|uniref:transcription elongation factor GreA n=1 Tax=Bacteroidetes bacterium endosymbiont of Geopemphigus sp. TaxID=2047937 RepID=UPI000CD09443|nr:transcription elongation factor GreA [Bacteroidetes bacterium endosymbiont of Geopemphigus sp.]
MAKAQYVTGEGLKKLREELEQLETLERPKISRQIAEARDKGDLSENAEYDAAKEAQGLMEMRIARLKEKIINARVIDSSQVDHSKVSILSTVQIKNITHGLDQSYTLVPESEADLKAGKISVNTPIAQGLLGKKIGETARIALPNGNELDLEVLKIDF